MRRRGDLDLIDGRVNGDGTVAYGEAFNCQRTGVGLYTVTFDSRFSLSTFIPATNSTGAYFPIAASTGNVVSIKNVNTSTLALTDAAFSFIASGVWK
jgi:hypothetical protein